MAPLERPVVPEVYWIAARSCTSGRGCRRLIGRDETSFSQLMVPLVPLVNAFFLARRPGSGSRSANCRCRGNALSRLTATIWVGRS